MPSKLTPELLAAATSMVEFLERIPDGQKRILQELAVIRAELAVIRQGQPPSLLSVNDAASKLGVTPRTVRRLLATGKLRAVRVGGRSRVDLRPIQEALPMRAEDLPR